MRRRARCVGVLAAAFAATFALSGCQDILNSLLDTAAPGGLDASDGDYPNSILVSWSAPSLSSEKWEGYSVTGYTISWTGPEADSRSTTSTSYSIPVSNADRATYYDVEVTAELSGGSEDGGTASDRGFAMDAAPLVWRDGGSSYTVSGGEQWYVTMLQKGFEYRFDFGSGTNYATFYPFESLGEVAGPLSGEDPQWKCDDDGRGNKFYVHVDPQNTDASFTARCDYGFGF